MPKPNHKSSESGLGEQSSDPPPYLSSEERAECEASYQDYRDYWDRTFEHLNLAAQSTVRAMSYSPRLGPDRWDKIVEKSLEDYKSGRALMAHLGADRLIDPALTGMLLAIRAGLLEEITAATIIDYLRVDIAVIAFANAMRIQSMIGNTALILEGELFGQPTLRAKWERANGSRKDLEGLAVEEHIARLRDRLLPVAREFNHQANEAVDGLQRQSRSPSAQVERSQPVEIRAGRPKLDVVR